MPRKAKAPAKPQEYVRHTAKPEWGVGVLVQETPESKTYLFADASKRTFKRELIGQLIVPAEAPGDEDRERLSRGLTAGGATPKAIHLELEAQIRARPDDAGTYLVYADWLQQRRDPRGELIPIQAKLLDDPRSRTLLALEQAFLEKHGDYLLPPNLLELLRLPRKASSVTWKLGFLDAVHLAKRPKQDGDLAAVIQSLLRHPSAHMLRSLSIGELGTPESFSFVPIVRAISDVGHPSLRELFIGDFDHGVMELAFTRLGSAAPLFRSLPNLEKLTLRAGVVRFDAIPKHDKLRELRITTCELSEANQTKLWAGVFPALESFELVAPPAVVLLDPAVKEFRQRHRAHLKHVQLPKRAPDAEGLLISEAEVIERAPDAASATAARKLAKPDKWLVLARDGSRLWGEFEGSDHYYVLAGLDARQETSCSCGSPKNPCKHSLALLFLAAADHEFEIQRMPDTLARQSRDRPRYGYWE